ncbi:MAG: hypothetical protein ACM3SO_02345 [Betaproteobacteria bacterium]
MSAFNAHRVEYLVVGAHALAAHGHVRATGDLDVWIRPETANAKRVIDALREFGAPLQDLTEADLTRAGTVFQIGVAPIRIDVLTHIDGVAFGEAWADRVTVRFVDLPVPVLSARHLVKNKRTVGRAQDLADVEWLEKHKP